MPSIEATKYGLVPLGIYWPTGPLAHSALLG